jgi:hypothetical protein
MPLDLICTDDMRYDPHNGISLEHATLLINVCAKPLVNPPPLNIPLEFIEKFQMRDLLVKPTNGMVIGRLVTVSSVSRYPLRADRHCPHPLYS